jgi:tripeptidyl-peptidase I
VPDKSYVAFTNFLNETVILKDLKMFLENHRPDAVSVSIVPVNNGRNDQNVFSYKSPDGKKHTQSHEGNLDGQTLTAMVYTIKVQAYNTGGEPPFNPTDLHKTIDNEPYLEWLDYMLTKEQNLPLTISISYGDDERTVPADYARHVCLLFGLLGSVGRRYLSHPATTGWAVMRTSAATLAEPAR